MDTLSIKITNDLKDNIKKMGALHHVIKQFVVLTNKKEYSFLEKDSGKVVGSIIKDSMDNCENWKELIIILFGRFPNDKRRDIDEGVPYIINIIEKAIMSATGKNITIVNNRV